MTAIADGMREELIHCGAVQPRCLGTSTRCPTSGYSSAGVALRAYAGISVLPRIRSEYRLSVYSN